MPDIRHLYARNRWHMVWVLLRDCLRHPNSARVIHFGSVYGCEHGYLHDCCQVEDCNHSGVTDA